MMSTRVALLLCLAMAGMAIGKNIHHPSGGRIVGGETARPGQFPYQVSLRYGPNGDDHFCGGSIIRPNWILTASHCVVNTPASAIVVVTGAHNLSAGGTAYNVSEVVMHADFNGTYLENDIALLRTTVDITFNQRVRPISIGVGEHVPAGIAARASGWGTIYFQGPLPDELQYIDLTTLTNDDCRARHSTEFQPYIQDSVLCVYSSQPERGMCHGDSGGPLVSDSVLIGAVSYGYPCARGKPDTFTRISSFVPWILEHTDGVLEATTPADL